MRSTFTAIVLAFIVAAAGTYFYYHGNTPAAAPETQASPTAQTSTSTATDYDSCLAEGGQTLPDAPDKCLTTDGHVFIQGVTE